MQIAKCFFKLLTRENPKDGLLHIVIMITTMYIFIPRSERDPLFIMQVDLADAGPQAELFAEVGLMASSLLTISLPPEKCVLVGQGKALPFHYGQAGVEWEGLRVLGLGLGHLGMGPGAESTA